jgi:polysaccharide export outer membrane protein
MGEKIKKIRNTRGARMNFAKKKIAVSSIMIIMGLFVSQALVNAQSDKEVSPKSTIQSQVPPDSDKYLIGPEDSLLIQVWKEDALSQQVLVRTDGKISLPLIDEVQAAGRTPLQLKEVLTEKFKEFVDAPLVTVMVREAKSFKVYVSGQVARPGVFPLVGETTILQIIPMAGGFTEWANQKKVILIRREKGQETRMTINFKNIISGEDMNANILLKPGDTIIVPD